MPLKLKDALRANTVHTVRLAERLGEGAQAEVYRVARLNGRATPHVLKLYRTPVTGPAGRHLVAFAEHLAGCPDLGACPFLSLPLHVVVDEGQNRVGCLMPQAAGQPLMADLYQRLCDGPHGLAARLTLGGRLAEAVAALHRHRIVHADVTEPNVLVDPATLTPILLDADGGGVLASPLGPDYRPGLEPLVRGRFEGSALAPELAANPRQLPSPASDRWSLAVLLHRLLFGGLDPFFFLETFAEVLDPGARWPSHGPPGPRLRPWIRFHRAELRRLGPALRHRFCTAFNRAADGAQAPALRPRAEDWALDLEIAAGWILGCPGCQEQFVALDLAGCPFCGAAAPHARVWTRRKGLRLDREGKSLLGRDLGFTDRAGRYEVALFGRRRNEVLLTPRVPMRDLHRRRDHTPQDPRPIALGRGDHVFRVWSGDGRQRAEMRVKVP